MSQIVRPSSPTLCNFLDRNEHFISGCDPKLLEQCAQGQSPSVFWLGCSDSRVPEGVVIGAQPGEVFVHRNVANVFNPSDTSATAALAYAVNHLKVKHIVVVGHSSCGGCAAALAAASTTDAPAPADIGSAAISKWIEPIKQIATKQLQSGARADLPKLICANVQAQVKNVIEHEVIQKAWARGQELTVNGWLYDLGSGKLTDLGLSDCGKGCASKCC